MTSIAGLPIYAELAAQHEAAMQDWQAQALRAINARRDAETATERAARREALVLLGRADGVPAIEGKNATERDAALRDALWGDAIYQEYRGEATTLEETRRVAELTADLARARVRWYEGTLPLLAKYPAAEPDAPFIHIPHDVPTENCPTCDGYGWLRFTTAEDRPLGRMRCDAGCDDGQVVSTAAATPPDGGAAVLAMPHQGVE